MASASAVVGSTVCFTSTLVFSRFEIDAISFASSGLTFFELNLGTVILTFRLGLEGAMVEVAVTIVDRIPRALTTIISHRGPFPPCPFSLCLTKKV